MMDTVRDPVHGDIALRAVERRVLDLPVMQRLRGVRQLGTAYLVFPGALHTRFDHALGALQMAGRILAVLGEHTKLDDDLESAVRIACLLHDVSHVPFGHTMEDERQLFERHDAPGRMQTFLADSELQRTLGHLGPLVEDTLLRRRVPAWCRDIVSGTIDADLLDYVHRDAYFTGLSQRYDERLFSGFALHEDRLVFDLRRGGIERSDARSELLHLLRLRYFLTERVYLHHTKVAAGAMIAKAVETAVLEGRFRRGDLDSMGDEVFLWRLSQGAWGEQPRFLADAVRQRRLVRRAYVLARQDLDSAAVQRLIAAYSRDPQARDAAERDIRSLAGASGPVIVHVPPLPALKELQVPVLVADGLSTLAQRPGVAIEAQAMDLSYENLWQLMVFAWPQERLAVAQAAAEFFGLPNRYDASAKMGSA